MSANLLDGTGWVHIADFGWVYRQGDGWLYSDNHKQWEYRPDLLTPNGELTDPPPIPVQARAQHAANTVKARLTTGPVVPLVPTESGLFSVVEPPAPKVMDDSNAMHRRGWPTWQDAWGVKGMRPGGAIRALLRGYTRLWMYAILPFCLTSLLAHDSESVMAGFGIAFVTAIPVWAICLPILYIARCYDFDRAKGMVAQGIYGLFIAELAHRNRRRPMPASLGMGPGETGKFPRPANVPPWMS